MKRVFVSNLKEGMIVGRDIYTEGNLLILPAGVVLTKAIIEHLESLDLLDILIDDEKKPEDVEPKEPVQSPNFIEFNKNYTSQINKLNNTFDKILENGASKEEVENLLENTWESMPQTSNTYEMLNMLYSMHSYSDATYMHCMNVGIIASLIGKWMGWSEEDRRILYSCGLLHDIGKLAIPKSILDKPGKLTDIEYTIMKTHTVKGYEMLRNSGIDKRLLYPVLKHHERLDGSGYPLQLKEDKIDRYTKVIAVADVYEAMTADRVYRKSMCPFDVIAQFENTGFGVFDTEILLVFLHNIVNSYLNAKVKLSNGEEAEVVLVNRQAGSKPLLMTSSGKIIDMLKEKDIKISEMVK